MIPDFLVHYYLPHRNPFQNLSDLNPIQKKHIVQTLNKEHKNGLMKRAFPKWYFEQRAEAEKNLKKAAIKLGENTNRNSPHYFCLGRSIGMEYVYNNNYKKIVVPLRDINCNIYFSIGDTLWTFAKSKNPKQKWKNKWYQGKLYNYEETIKIIKDIKLDLGSKESLNSNNVFNIEALIWSDDEIKNILK